MLNDFTSSLAILEEPGGLEAVLLNAHEMTLLAEVKDAADMLNLPASSFASLAIRRFVARADDEDWVSLTTSANSQSDAMGSVVARILRKAVSDVKETMP